MAVLYLAEQGATLRKEAGLLTVSKEGQTIQKVPAVKVEQVVILGNINLTTPAIAFMLQEGIDCVFLSSRGKYHGRLISSESGFALLRQKQFELAASLERRLAIARQVVVGKLSNQRTLLMRYGRRGEQDFDAAVDRLGVAIERARGAHGIGSLNGFEGQGSAIYYEAFRALLKRTFGFSGRNRRPPRDPVNAALSFGYTLLTYAVQSAVRTVGLDPFLGVLHVVEYSRPSLALDLIEEFRAIVVDSLVLRGVNTGVLLPEHFRDHDEEPGAVLLNDEGVKLIVRFFEERMNTAVTYPPTGEKTTYRRIFELQARQVARLALGGGGDYAPFLVE